MSGPATGPRIAYVPALDGLRGAAVLAVVAFHLGRLDGGYLGVDAFFVLSGFLITSLLLAEHRDRGGIALGEFWGRRARRLLPAVLVLLAVVAAWAAWGAEAAQREQLRGDGLAGLFYLANWRSIVVGAGYWETVAPSPVRHLWSLAIEEQFYLVWPLVVSAVLVWGRRSTRFLGVLAAAGAVVSAGLLAWWFDPAGDPSRLYYGTDTRAAAILVGTVVAVVHHRRGPLGARPALALRLVASLAVVALAVAWWRLDGTDPLLYRGGLAACGLGVAIVVWAVAQPGRWWLGGALSWRPLRAAGLVSYGLYLWHWPVIVWLDGERTGLDGWALDAVRLAVTLAVTLASYWLVEQPIRRRRVLRGRSGLAGALIAPAAVTGALLVATVATAGPLAARTPTGTLPPLTTVATVAPSEPPTTAGGGPGSGTTAPATTAPAARALRSVVLVGDSGAALLGEGVVAAAEGSPTAVYNRGTIGCGVARSTGVARTDDGRLLPDPAGCAEYPTRFTADVDAARPDVALLVLAWPGYGDRVVQGSWQHPCQPAFDAWYQGEVETGLQALRSPGTRVVMATVPYLTRQPPGPDASARIDCLNAVYRNAAAARGAEVLDLAAWACPAGRCRTELDGVELRPDGLHFEGPGAVVAGRWVLDRLAATPA